MKPFLFRLACVVCLLLSGAAGLMLSLHREHDTTSTLLPATPNGVQTIQTFHYPESFSEQLKHNPHPGEAVFHQYCHSCHDVHPVIPIHAPTVADKAAWRALSKVGMAQLVAISAQGVAAMPARGGCFECTDKQLQQAIVYMMKRAGVDFSD